MKRLKEFIMYVFYAALGGKYEGKRPLGKPRHGWEDNIRMDFREMGWDVVE
jgi:hypothetical protein